MLRPYSFFLIFGGILLGLGWGSKQVQEIHSANTLVEGSSHLLGVPSGSPQDSQRELVEVLDRIVVYQHYYHSVYGRFTKLLNKIGFIIPIRLSELYDIRIEKASADQLLIIAVSEGNGAKPDLISIDQDYQVHSNFTLPLPHPEFLKERAVKHLRLLRNVPKGQTVAEEGVFKGYFNYSIKTDSKSEKVISALGIRSPVLGVRLELDSEPDLPWNPGYPTFSDSLLVGQHQSGIISHEGDATLAQKIFYGEMGRYAKTWSELSKISHFRFEEVNRKITSNPSFAPLEIEPISPEVNSDSSQELGPLLRSDSP